MRGSLAKKIRRNTDYMTAHSDARYAAVPFNRGKPTRLSLVLIDCDRALYQMVKRSLLRRKRMA